MDEWVEAHVDLCKVAIAQHLADGDRDTGRFGMDLRVSMKASAQALPSERKKSLVALGNRLARDAGPTMPVKSGLAGKTLLREPRDQLMFDVGTVLGGKAPR